MNRKLSVFDKLKFGVGEFGLSAITAMLQFYMLFFYTDIVGINPGLAGTAMLVGKITWDMVNDVLFGYFEDMTKSRWGRRRPYLIFCSIPLMLAFWLLMSIPEGLSGATAFWTIIGTFILFDTFHTLVATAYSAMTAEITEDYDERTSVSTYRMVFSIVGYLLGAGITAVLADIISNSFGISIKDAWSYIGLIYGAIAAITLLIPGLFLKTPVLEIKKTEFPPIKAVFSTLKNKPFTKFLIISMIMSTAFTMVTTMLPYYLIYQLDMADSQLIVMFLMLGTLAIFLVPCAIMSGKIGKAKTYALGIIIAGSALSIGFLLPQGKSTLIYVLAAIVGLGFSSQWVCPHSMMPDVIEYDELETGERREGIYYGMQATAGKITGALGSAMCGWGLEWFGYVDGAKQSASALFAIRGMFALIPAILLLICVPLLLKYPVTKESHEKVVEKLKIRREGDK